MAAVMKSDDPQAIVAVEKLDKIIEETRTKDASIAWEGTVHELGIGGVTVTVTGALYSILTYVYSYLTTANITWFITELATALGTTVEMLLPWMTPDVIILLLLATVLGNTIEPITVEIAVRSTSDPSVRAIRVEQVRKAGELMKIPGNKAYEAVKTLFEKVSDDARKKATEVAAAVSSAAADAASVMGSAVSSATADAASAMRTGVVYAREFIVGPPEVRLLRDDILTLRRAIYIYTEASKAAKGDSLADKQVRDNANYLLGQTVTVMDKSGLKDEDIEEYLAQGLPGVTGKATEVSAAASRSARALSRWLSRVSGKAIDTISRVGNYVFHGKLAKNAKEAVKSPLTEAAEELDSMIRTYHEQGIRPPAPRRFKREREEEVVSSAKRERGSTGRHTVRKHKKKSKSATRRRKTVSHRHGKRTYHRRRANSRTTKRSKK